LIASIHAIKKSSNINPPILSTGYLPSGIISFPPREKEATENSSFIENTPDYITKLSRELRKKQTTSEEFLWEILRRKQLN